jgi:hypothetical protein
MMKKVWLILLAVVLVFGLAMLGCGGKSSSNNGGGGEEEEELVPTLVFDMATDSRIQGLDAGPLTISDTDGGANPIKPLTKAGNNNEHVTGWQAVDIGTGGNKQIALQYTTGATWGVGIDLRYADFDFHVDDEITVTGEVVSGGDPSNVKKLHLNGKVGNNNPVILSESEDKDAVNGPFTLTGKVSADDLKNIKGGDPATVRLETRVTGVTMKITNITVNGLRPANIKALAAPVVTATETGVSWEAIEGAGGYKVYADGITDPIASLGPGTTSLDISILDEDDYPPGAYSITVVAIGIPGSSKDSAASTAVSFTKAAQPTYKFKLKVAGVEQEVQVKGIGGSIAEETDGSGFTFTQAASYGNSYAYFGVTFAGTDKLSSFQTMKFVLDGIAGDRGYKNATLQAKESKFKGALSDNTPVVVNAGHWIPYANGPDYDGDRSAAFQNGPRLGDAGNAGEQHLDSNFTIVKDESDKVATSTVYFSIFINAGATGGGAATSYKISNIEFVKGTAGALAKSSAPLDNIKIKLGTLSKSTYKEGETFNPAGLKITKNYKFTGTDAGFGVDGDYNTTDFDLSAAGGVDLTAPFAASATPIKVTVALKSDPTKTAWFNVTITSFDLDALKALSGGITIGVGGDTSPTFDAATKVVTVTGSSSTIFYIDFADVTGLTVAAGNALKITYACIVEAGQGKVIVKNGKNSWTDFSPGVYKTFEQGESKTITGITATAATDGITFQHNVDGNTASTYYVKILNVEVLAP